MQLHESQSFAFLQFDQIVVSFLELIHGCTRKPTCCSYLANIRNYKIFLRRNVKIGKMNKGNFHILILINFQK